MDQLHADTNPEFAFHYERIRSARNEKRVRGYILLFACGALTTGTVVLATGHLFDITPYMGTLALLALLDITMLIICVRSVKQGNRPITNEEVDTQRQAERKQLFQYAQGITPWWYRRITIVLLFLYSLLLMAPGGWYLASLLLHHTNLSEIHLVGIFILLFTLSGIYYFIKAIQRARMARQLVKFSSRELSLRFGLGENTKGE